MNDLVEGETALMVYPATLAGRKLGVAGKKLQNYILSPHPNGALDAQQLENHHRHERLVKEL